MVAGRPHLVFALADDFGWANLGLHRQESAQGLAEAQTPNLDALATDGITLSRHYAYKICSPSRSALQSGRLAVHVNTQNTAVSAHNPDDPVSGYAGIPRNMTCVANKLSEAGYRTHFVGKWDAGMATPRHTPQGRGYDTWYGYYQHSNDYWSKTMGAGLTGIQTTGEIDVCLNHFIDLSEGNATYFGGVRDSHALSAACNASIAPDPSCYEDALFKQRSLRIIREHNASSPLFLFHAFHVVHTPLQVPRAYLAKVAAAAAPYRFDDANRQRYAAMVRYMDDTIGELTTALRARGMWANTVLAFSADNGGPIYEPGAANNHPLKGGKYSDWEGGLRVRRNRDVTATKPRRDGDVFA